MRNRTPHSVLAVLALGLALGGAACGSDDDDSATPAAEDPTTEAATDGTASVDVGDDLLDVIDEETGGDLDQALDAVGFETVMETVGNQIGASSVEVDGDDARITMDDGSVADALMDCIVAGTFTDEGQTVTIVYPDGEQLCD